VRARGRARYELRSSDARGRGRRREVRAVALEHGVRGRHETVVAQAVEQSIRRVVRFHCDENELAPIFLISPQRLGQAAVAE